ncbi:AfsR/SARP family transcriptional regulator [Nocardiopsis aegyptia]|uniref:DNA-binding SARP family transcriptional activator n=1 Tax=Nocardiopsis aegyptia TaxID=220378 RepID=A0A7Z0ESX9_9ACTN|nr:BTAD domain-containing putative transcriptional regulator [Nocardiopsis aegyptia]NYJ37718.1 DNA-binding SARP family transcriptional activator [Nocardiopsis aegyptia]
MTLEISVLGDIAARIDGRPVDLGHVRRQSVFLGLLADANRPVTADRLIDRVWGQRPPGGARSSLYSYVSRLRSALGASGGDVGVERRPGGYVLTVGPDVCAAIDLCRFRDLVTRARASPSGGPALALYEDAFRLWRADALGALDSPWINETREQLRLERFRAELDRNDLLLRQGRQAALLGDLIALAERHPLDERLIGQLMLTLYREGRAAQALERFESTRKALGEEMGTDPGTELRDLHLRILNSDPALDASSPAAAPVPSPRPRPVPAAAPPAMPPPGQLPPPPPLLTGREEGLAALDAALRPGAVPVTVICGLGGVGKTSLALRWAHDNLDRFPDGQLYVNLHGFSPSTRATTPQTAVHDLLTALGVDQKAVPASTDAQFGLYRTLLARQRILILLDNARDAEQVRPLIPGSSSCAVVVTSRDRLSGLVATEGARSVTLDPLTSAAARALFTARVGERRAAREPDAVETIVAAGGRLPLALTITAAHAMGAPHLPLAELASELRETATRLDLLDTGDAGTSLRSVFDASYRALPGPAARLLGLLSLAPGQCVGLPATAALAGLAHARTRALLRVLESAHLVHRPAPGRYELHDLVRLHSRERAERDQSEQDRRRALCALVDHYVRAASAGNRRLGPHDTPSTPGEEPGGGTATPLPSDETAAMAWFAAERSWLPAVVRLASELGLHRQAWRLCWDAHLYLRRCGPVEDFIGNARAGLDAAARLDDPDAPTLRALSHRGLASALLLTGHPGAEPAGHLVHALARFEETGDLLNQAHTHQALLLSAILTGDEHSAVDHGERSLDLYRTVGHAWWEAGALNNLGWCLARFGRHDLGYEHCRAALDACVALGNRHGEADALDSLGYAAGRAGRHAEAVAHYRRAVRLYRSTGDAIEEADSLSGLAEAHDALDESDHARVARRRALALYREQHRTEQVRETERRLRDPR